MCVFVATSPVARVHPTAVLRQATHGRRGQLHPRQQLVRSGQSRCRSGAASPVPLRAAGRCCGLITFYFLFLFFFIFFATVACGC